MQNAILAQRRSIRLFFGLLVAFSLVFTSHSAGSAQTTSTTKLFGYVRDSESGLSIPGVNVDLRDASGEEIANMNTGNNGYYEFVVTTRDQFHISATVWVKTGEYVLCDYVPAWTDVRPGGTNELETDFSLAPGGNLIVYAYDSEGNLVRRAKMQEVTSENLYVTDMQDSPNGGQSFVVQDSFSLQEGQWDLTLPAFVVPLRVSNRLHVFWEVPGFGRVLLEIDNQGKGYTLSKQGDYYIIRNLAYEAAVSEYAGLMEKRKEFTLQGYSLAQDVLNEIQASTDDMHAAEDIYANSAPDSLEVTAAANRALKTILNARQSLMLGETNKPTATAQVATSVKLFGHIRDVESGQPVSGAYIDLRDSRGTPIANLTTGSTGYYEFTVPRQDRYQMNVSVWADSGGYNLSEYVPASISVAPRNADKLETNVDLTPGANLIIQAYDSSGNLLRWASLHNMTFNDAYVTDLHDVPVGGQFFAVKDSFALHSNSQWDQALPAFVVPLGTAARLHVLWDVPGFGKVLVNIDNLGTGYEFSSQGDDHIIKSLAYEAAGSEYVRLQQRQKKLETLGYLIPQDLLNRIKVSADDRQAAETAYTSFPPNQPEVTDAANRALKSILTAQEELALFEAEQSIEPNRHGTLTTKVVDETGKPLEGVTVSYEQKSHDFLFGANPMGPKSEFSPTYATLMRDAGINYSYVTFPWESVEPTPGDFRWDGMETYQDMPAQENYGFEIMGGMAFYFNRIELGTNFSPLYQDQMTYSALKMNVYEHMRTIAAQYKNRITIWEFLEQNTQLTNPLNLTWEQKFELIGTAIEGLRAGNPKAKVIITGNALPYEINSVGGNPDSSVAEGMSFYEFLGQLSAHNINYDEIGLEIFYSEGKPNSSGYVTPCITMAALSDMLDLYSGFGKPLSITQLSAPSARQPGAFVCWHQPWDEALQAEYLKDIYTISFSKPMLKEIGWAYGVSDAESYVASGGVLDSSLQPKASYHMLKELLTDRWMSKGMGTTGVDGTVQITGLAGDYEVRVTAEDGVSTNVRLHVSEQQHNAALITLSVPNQTTTTTAAADRNNSATGLAWWGYLLVIAAILFGLLLILRTRKRTI